MLSAHILQMQNKKEIRIPDIELSDSRFIGMFGESGCGKTTLLDSLYLQLKQRSAYMKQDVLMSPHLTVQETLFFYHGLRSVIRLSQEQIDEVLSILHITSLRDTRIGSFEDKRLSGGEKKRIMLACLTLFAESVHVWLLDEPFSGLDEENMVRCFQHITTITRTYCLLTIASCHVIPQHLKEQLDETWQIQNPDILIASNDTIHSSCTQALIRKPPGFQIIAWLLWREFKCLSRSPRKVFIRMVIPWTIIGFQSIIFSPVMLLLSYFLRKPNQIIMLHFVLLYQILLFTTAITPMGALVDCIEERDVVIYEIAEGYYSRRQYLLTKIFLDEMMVIITALGVVLITMAPFCLSLELNFFLFIDLFSIMSFTYLLLWLATYKLHLSHSTALVLATAAVSISFAFSIGSLMQFKNRIMSFFQYTSMQHIQGNVFLLALRHDYPDMPEIENLVSLINLSNVIGGPKGWLMYGFAWLGVILVWILS